MKGVEENLNKNDLFASILEKQTDIEKRDELKKYGNVKLYRYRPYNGTQGYEFETLRKKSVWLSRPDKFDDDLEGTITKTQKNDIDAILHLLSIMDKAKAISEVSTGNAGKEIRKNNPDIIPYVINAIMQGESLSRNARRMLKNHPKLVGDMFNDMMKSYRKNYLMTCFSENNPLESNNMWKQYCSDGEGNVSGFCLEYNLFDILDQGEIISPIYYKNNVSIFELCHTFNYHVESIFLHKEEQGYDSKKDPNHTSLISWKEQREWRIVKMNEDTNSEGKLLGKKLVPSKAFYLDTMPNQNEFTSLIESFENSSIAVNKIDIRDVL